MSGCGGARGGEGGKGRGKEGPGRRFSPLRVEARSRARGYGKKVNAPQPRTHSRPTQRASLCERQEMRGQTSGERSVPGAHRPFAATHTARSLLSRSMQRAHVCNPVSTSRVLSTLPIGRRTSNHKFQRPPQRSPAPILYSLLSLRSSKPFDLGLSRAFVPFFLLSFLPIRTIMDRVAFEPRYYETEKDPRGFFFFSFSTIDAAGRSENFPEKKWSATEQWVATEIRVCALFPLARGRGEERGRARELRVRPRSGVVATLLPFPRTKGSLTRWRAYAWPADPDVTRGHVNRG